MNKLVVVFAAFTLVSSTLPAAAGAQDRKTRKQLEKENVQLRQRLEAIQQELEWMKTDAHERDSLQKQLEELYREDRNVEAAGMGAAVDYFDSPGDFQDGYQDGMEKHAVETARRMLKKRFDLADIAECSGLSIDQVAALSANSQ